MSKIRLYDGSLIDPFNFSKADIKPEVLIHQLCLINRFHGATKYPYSVAQHSLNLYYLVPPHLKAAALIHDLQEALFNDLAAPVKYECPSYVVAEAEAGRQLAKIFEIYEPTLEELKPYDKSIYVNERDALFYNIDETGMGDEREPLWVPPGLDTLFEERSWRAVKEEFLEVFRAEFCNV